MIFVCGIDMSSLWDNASQLDESIKETGEKAMIDLFAAMQKKTLGFEENQDQDSLWKCMAKR